MRRKTLQADIGRALGISRQRVHVLAKRGMPVDDVGKARAWRAEHLDADLVKPDPRAPAAGTAPNGELKQRLLAAKVQREEHRGAVERGEFLPRAEVLATWTRRFADVRARLLSIPNRIGSRTSEKALRDEVLLAVEQELYEAMLDISGTRGEPDV